MGDKTFTRMDKILLVGGLLSVKYLEKHGGEAPSLAVLLSATIGGSIIGLLDTQSSPVVKILSIATVASVTFTCLPLFTECYGRHSSDVNLIALLAAGVTAAVFFHFFSGFLVDKNPLDINSLGLPLDDDPKYAMKK